MLIQKDLPTVLHDNNSSFNNISNSMLSYSGDSEVVDFVAAEDKLYFGRYKPWSAMYIEMSVVNTNAVTMTVEYFDTDTSDWVAVIKLVDETKGMTRSGFVHFDPLNTHASVPWIQNTINSVEQYWLRVSLSGDVIDTTAIQGWNLVFSDDIDLGVEYPGISSYLRTDQNSFILAHQQARTDILNQMMEDGKFKLQVGVNKNDGMPAHLTHWDILDVSEVNQWSTKLALANIFRSLIVSPDDQFTLLHRDYKSEATKAKNVFYLTLDKDDDGTKDTEEILGEGNREGRVFRR